MNGTQGTTGFEGKDLRTHLHAVEGGQNRNKFFRVGQKAESGVAGDTYFKIAVK